MAPAPPTPLDVPAEQRRDYVALYESRAGVETAIGNMVALPLSDAHRAQVIEDSMLGSPSARRAWPEAGMIEDISDAAKTITVPVHVVVGAEDRVETEASLRAAFAAVVPDVTYAVLPEVGHLAPLEAPAEVAAAIRATAGA